MGAGSLAAFAAKRHSSFRTTTDFAGRVTSNPASVGRASEKGFGRTLSGFWKEL
jgi:hypothetical protein